MQKPLGEMNGAVRPRVAPAGILPLFSAQRWEVGPESVGWREKDDGWMDAWIVLGHCFKKWIQHAWKHKGSLWAATGMLSERQTQTRAVEPFALRKCLLYLPLVCILQRVVPAAQPLTWSPLFSMHAHTHIYTRVVWKLCESKIWLLIQRDWKTKTKVRLSVLSRTM